MAIGPATAKELARLGANLEIRDGIGPATIKEIVRIASAGQNITVSSKVIGPATAKELARIGKNKVTIIIEK